MTLRELILDLSDDDYTGLWELVWRANTLIPEEDPREHLERLRGELELLIQEGTIKLFRGTSFSGEEKLVPAHEVPDLLADASSWDPPATHQAHLRILSTPERR